MNLSQFKVIGQDNEHYHLSHPSGQKMSVAKALLSGPAKKAIEKMCSGGEVQRFDGGGSVLDLPESQDAVAAASAMPPSQESAASLLSDAPSTAQVAASGAPATAAAPDQAPTQQTQDPLITHGVDTDTLLSQEQQQIGDLAKAQVGEAGESAKAYKDYNDKMAQMQTPEELMESYKQKDDELMKGYLSKTIDPDRYIHHMSTGSKIGAGISMILGGLGQGLIGGKNSGTEWLNNAIGKDIEAQKDDQGSAYNLWRMNRDAMGDDMRANIATKNQMWTGVQAKIAQAAAGAQAPIAKFRAQQSINDIENQKIQNRRTLGLLSQGMQGPGGTGFSQADPAQLVQQMVPKELQPKAYEEIGVAQDTARATPKVLDSFDKAANNIHGADFVPGMQNVDQKSLHTLLGPTFKDVEGTVRQAAMDNLFNNITPQFGDDKNTIDTKRKALVSYLHSKQSAPITKGNNIDLSRFQSTTADPMARLNSQDRQAVQWAKANPNDPRSQTIFDKNGI